MSRRKRASARPPVPNVHLQNCHNCTVVVGADGSIVKKESVGAKIGHAILCLIGWIKKVAKALRP